MTLRQWLMALPVLALVSSPVLATHQKQASEQVRTLTKILERLQDNARRTGRISLAESLASLTVESKRCTLVIETTDRRSATRCYDSMVAIYEKTSLSTLPTALRAYYARPVIVGLRRVAIAIFGRDSCDISAPAGEPTVCDSTYQGWDGRVEHLDPIDGSGAWDTTPSSGGYWDGGGTWDTDGGFSGNSGYDGGGYGSEP